MEAPLDDPGAEALGRALDELADETRAELAAQGIGEERVRVLRRAHVRYDGTDTADLVDAGGADEMKTRFEDAHRRRYGFVMPWKGLVIEAASVEAIGSVEAGANPFAAEVEGGPAKGGDPGAAPGSEPAARAGVWFAGEERETPIYTREALAAGAVLDGPAVILESTATTVVEPGWRATLAASGDLVLERVVSLPRESAAGTDCDPVMLEVFNNRFMSIAEQMGLTLENTALSVNIKERLDFSCALFDPDGMLVANAPHIPIHLGSMGESVVTVARENRGRMKPGDVFCVNAPYNRRHPPPRRDRHHPGVRRGCRAGRARRVRRAPHPVLRREPRPPRGHRRVHAGLDAPRRAHGGGGGDPLRQLHAGGRGALPRGRAPRPPRGGGGGRPATRTRTSPTSRPRSRPERKASRKCAG